MEKMKAKAAGEFYNGTTVMLGSVRREQNLCRGLHLLGLVHPILKSSSFPIEMLMQ